MSERSASALAARVALGSAAAVWVGPHIAAGAAVAGASAALIKARQQQSRQAEDQATMEPTVGNSVTQDEPLFGEEALSSWWL